MSDDVPSGTDQITDPAGGFAELGLRPEVLRALTGLGYEEPTPIQREAITEIVAGRDLVGQAATGTGKTAAFALPILERVVEGAAPEPLALILVPTRELAVQVSEAIYKYGRHLGTEVLPIYGGQPIVRQLKVLQRGVHVVVATPGRAIDHINRGTLNLDHVEIVVLDEADEMLDMGFAEDLDAILQATPDTRQTVLFSATMPPRIEAIARRHLTDPVRIRIQAEQTPEGEAPRVSERVYVVARAHKPAALGRILDVEAPEAALVFCRTRTEVDELTETLNGRGYRAEALHGGMDQLQRDRVMGRLRSGAADLLVATDVAARGLDIDHLTHVVNYDVPSAPESYVHRVGRVGRAGREGVAITLAEPRERRQISNIERVARRKLSPEKVPTVADLRAAQNEQILGSLREALEADDSARFLPAVEALAGEFELADVAAAALKLAHDATSGSAVDDQEIPDAADRPRRDRGDRDRPDRDRGPRDRDRGPRPDRDRGDRGGRDRDRSRGGDGDVDKLFINVGKMDSVRPGDLVGAITGESRLQGRDIGAIQIFEKFSLVEVPAGSAEDVIRAMRNTTIRGRKATIRRDRGRND
ncbi:MAG: DEAD/DEAH box helicase [Acidimicrobiales bacterium]